MKPMVSVIMPVFNAEMFLVEAVNSILGQTLREFEFIVIDDGSTDDTAKILGDYTDSRLKIITQSRNKGISIALNLGIAEAQGEFIARQDADDRSMPERLQAQVTYLKMHPKVGLVGTAAYLIDQQGKRIGTRCVVTEDEYIRLSLLAKTPFCHPTVMMRTSLLKEVGGYREEYPFSQDYDLFLRLASKTQLAQLPLVLFEKREWKGAVSRTKRPLQRKLMKQIHQLAWEQEKQVWRQFEVRQIFRLWSKFRIWQGCSGKELLAVHGMFFELCMVFFEDKRFAEQRRATFFTLMLVPLSWRSWFALGLYFYNHFPFKIAACDKYIQWRRYGRR